MIGTLACVVVLSVAGLWPARRPASHPRSAPPDERARTKQDAVAARFVGDEVCAGCHHREFELHTASNHALTLRPMERKHLMGEFPSHARFTDRETGARYELTETGGRFTLSVVTPTSSEAREVDYALGSGKRAMTFISRDGEEAVVELRMSYFPERRAGFVTPGQHGTEAPSLGLRHERSFAQRCFACHATVLPESRMVPEPRFMGVGCEACHGPGLAHVTQLRSGGTPGPIENFRDGSARRLNNLCGECHRTERDVDPHNAVAVSQTQRMQPYGLMKSACFQKSGDRLSCLTCHDPHRNVETTPASYERACRSCHGHVAGSVVCPVNRRTGCVRCHMPDRELLPGLAMSDHWIRVYPTSAPADPP